jgi:hypothetical protein
MRQKQMIRREDDGSHVCKLAIHLKHVRKQLQPHKSSRLPHFKEKNLSTPGLKDETKKHKSSTYDEIKQPDANMNSLKKGLSWGQLKQQLESPSGLNELFCGQENCMVQGKILRIHVENFDTDLL